MGLRSGSASQRRRVRRGRFLRTMEEDVQVRRVRPQRQLHESEYIYPLPQGETLIKAIIRPRREGSDVGELVVHDFSYVCNLTPVYPEIKLNDEVVRNVGTSREEVLRVSFLDVVEEILQLQLSATIRVIE